jgi:hypothetical protein
MWLALGIVGIVALAMPRAWLPGDDPGLRRFVPPEVTGDATMSQTFVMTADGFHAVEVVPIATGRVSGSLRFDLSDITDGVRPIHSVSVPAATLVDRGAYRMDFSAIEDSGGQTYRLDISADGNAPARGVAFVATKGVRYRGGTLWFNDRERWADLAFRTFAPDARSSGTLLTAGSAGVTGFIVLGLLIAYWLLFGLALQALFRAYALSAPS